MVPMRWRSDSSRWQTVSNQSSPRPAAISERRRPTYAWFSGLRRPIGITPSGPCSVTIGSQPPSGSMTARRILSRSAGSSRRSKSFPPSAVHGGRTAVRPVPEAS